MPKGRDFIFILVFVVAFNVIEFQPPHYNCTGVLVTGTIPGRVGADRYVKTGLATPIFR
jgi:hypothetical protein